MAAWMTRYSLARVSGWALHLEDYDWDVEDGVHLI